jgi:hypothetical protein
MNAAGSAENKMRSARRQRRTDRRSPSRVGTGTSRKSSTSRDVPRAAPLPRMLPRPNPQSPLSKARAAPGVCAGGARSRCLGHLTNAPEIRQRRVSTPARRCQWQGAGAPSPPVRALSTFVARMGLGDSEVLDFGSPCFRIVSGLLALLGRVASARQTKWRPSVGSGFDRTSSCFRHDPGGCP